MANPPASPAAHDAHGTQSTDGHGGAGGYNFSPAHSLGAIDRCTGNVLVIRGRDGLISVKHRCNDPVLLFGVAVVEMGVEGGI